MQYEMLSETLRRRMEHEAKTGTFTPFGFDNARLLRRNEEKQPENGWYFNPFIRDIDKILHSPYFNRYADKTQVYSLFQNDDFTRRSLHVQLVSRIARTIGAALHLNLDLIEAIALGHDVGHPAFAHTGERLLNKLYHENTGRYFLHNIHSVRVLDKIHGYNLSLQTLDGIASHNGELELSEYRPVPVRDFAEFDARMEKCAQDKAYADKIMPSTMEGATVRISDIIAYLGKDREDAVLAGAAQESDFADSLIGKTNDAIVNSLIVNVIENSYGQPYIRLDEAHFAALRNAKAENYEKIYDRAGALTGLSASIEPMMTELYYQLLEDLRRGVKTSPIFTHHIRSINRAEYAKTEPNQLVVDYIASMTDDYFIVLYGRLFPQSAHKLQYRGYFDE